MVDPCGVEPRDRCTGGPLAAAFCHLAARGVSPRCLRSWAPRRVDAGHRPSAGRRGLEETGTRERRVRLLPTWGAVCFVLALVFFECLSYRAVWNKLGTGLCWVAVAQPCTSSLLRARRRLGSDLLHQLRRSGGHSGPDRFLLPWLAGGCCGRHHPQHPRRGDDDLHFPKHRGPVLEFGIPSCAWWRSSSTAPAP
ncbi:transposase domain-containing protein [Streptomyces sp. NPDC001177]